MNCALFTILNNWLLHTPNNCLFNIRRRNAPCFVVKHVATALILRHGHVPDGAPPTGKEPIDGMLGVEPVSYLSVTCAR